MAPNIIAAQKTVCFMEATTDDDLIRAKQLCQQVYIHAGYITGSQAAAVIRAEREARTTCVIARNEQSEIVGTIRLSTDQPCRTFSVWRGKLYHPCAELIAAAQRGPSFEIGALAVRKDAAQLKVSWGLYDFAYRWALAHGMEYGIVSMDLRALRALELTGWYAVRIGAPMQYVGSLTVPAIIPINHQPAIAAAKAQAWFQHSTHCLTQL